MPKCQWDQMSANFGEVGARCDRLTSAPLMLCEVHLQRLCTEALKQARPRDPDALAKHGRKFVLGCLTGVGSTLMVDFLKHYWPQFIAAVESIMITIPPAGAEGTEALEFWWGDEEVVLLSLSGWDDEPTIVVGTQLGMSEELAPQIERGDGWTAIGRILAHALYAPPPLGPR